jgi:hypothetical protein
MVKKGGTSQSRGDPHKDPVPPGVSVPPSPILPVRNDTTLIMAKLDALLGRMDLSEKKTHAQSEEFLDFKASNVAVLDCVNLKFAEVF